MLRQLDRFERVEVTSRASWRAWLRPSPACTGGIWPVTWKMASPEKRGDGLPSGSKRINLQWIACPKAGRTRARRIADHMAPAPEDIRANHHRT